MDHEHLLLKESYLLQVAAACANEHHSVIAVRVRSHGCHTVGPIVKQRSAFNDLQPSERLIQNQATEIITNLLGLQEDKIKWSVTG